MWLGAEPARSRLTFILSLCVLHFLKSSTSCSSPRMNDSRMSWSLIFFRFSFLCCLRCYLTIWRSTWRSAISFEDVMVR